MARPHEGETILPTTTRRTIDRTESLTEVWGTGFDQKIFLRLSSEEGTQLENKREKTPIGNDSNNNRSFGNAGLGFVSFSLTMLARFLIF